MLPLIQTGGGGGGVAWSSLLSAIAALTLSNADNATTFNQTSAVNWSWANTTAATSGASQSSPNHILSGQYWNGAASAEDKWTLQNVIGTGTNGSSELVLTHSGSSSSVVAFKLATGRFSAPASSFTIPAFEVDRGTASGMCYATSQGFNSVGLTIGAVGCLAVLQSGNGVAIQASGKGLLFSNGDLRTTTADVGLHRLAAGSLGIGTTTAGDVTGKLTAADVWAKGFQSGGTSYASAANQIQLYDAGNAFVLQLLASGPIQRMSSTFNIGWTASNAGAAADSNISRLAAASLAIGNGTAADLTGTLTLATVITQSANGGQWVRGQASELLTLSTIGLTTDTTANLLPANSIIEAVVVRVTTTITTTTNWAVGDPTTSARFKAANATLTAGTTSVGIDQWSGAVTTLAAGPSQSAAAKVRITCTGSNPGAGIIRITVFYRQFVAPTS